MCICLITMIKWRESVYKGVVLALYNLSKAFTCLPHELLIAKLQAFGFDRKTLNLIYNYLSNGKQIVKVGWTYSSLREILCGAPQGSIL